MKRIFKILQNLVVAVVVAAAVGMMIFTVISVTVFDREDRSLFGYQAFIVLSDSMSATDFSAGDLVLTRAVDPATLTEGDIIAFRSQNSDNYGEIVTHKIRQLTTNDQGQPGFITYGTTTGQNDETIVTYDAVVGKYQLALPGVGRFFQFLKTVPGYLLCIFLPFFLLIVLQGIHSVRLFQEYRRLKTREMEAEFARQRRALDEERRKIEEKMAQSEKLLRELRAMRQTHDIPAQTSRPEEKTTANHRAYREESR